jgi:hypothetical protein
LALAPVATISVRVSSTEPSSSVTFSGCPDRSAPVTRLYWKRVPNRSAWARMRFISSVPSTPSGKPGKFSTSVVVVSCPPGCRPSTTSGFRLARAV